MEDEQIVRIPQPVSEPEETVEYEEVPEPEKPPMEQDMREDMSDLTSLDEEDKGWLFGTGGVVETEGEEDLSDLVDVSDEDIMGEDESEPKPRYRIVRRRQPSYREQPPTSMGGVQY